MGDNPTADLDILLAPPRPDIPVTTGSLILALGRAQMTRAVWERHVDRVRDAYVSATLDRSAHTFLLWNWMSLWLGCLAVVVEGFEEGQKHDPLLQDESLSACLASPNTAKLKGYRNKIFHPEPYTHEYVIRVLKELDDFVPWATALTDSFITFFRRYLLT